MGDSMTLQYDGVRPAVEGTLEGDTWTTTAVNYWEGPTYYSPLAARYLPNGGYNYLADGLGSTRQLMCNASHTITDTYVYDAFGNTLASTGSTDNPYRYVGALGYRAGGSPLLQLGARHLLPDLSRFTAKDPADLYTGASGLRSSAGWNYAGNPLLYVDPEGLISLNTARCLRDFAKCTVDFGIAVAAVGVAAIALNSTKKGNVAAGCAAAAGALGVALAAANTGIDACADAWDSCNGAHLGTTLGEQARAMARRAAAMKRRAKDKLKELQDLLCPPCKPDL